MLNKYYDSSIITKGLLDVVQSDVIDAITDKLWELDHAPPEIVSSSGESFSESGPPTMPDLMVPPEIIPDWLTSNAVATIKEEEKEEEEKEEEKEEEQEREKEEEPKLSPIELARLKMKQRMQK
jgi:hypothetical protein